MGMRKIKKETLGLIQALKELDLNKSEVSEILSLSWSTVNRYWGEEIKEENTKKRIVKEEKKGTISREDWKLLYRMFDQGKGKVDVIKETGMGDITGRVYKQYCKNKGIPHQVNVLDDIEKLKKQVKENRDNLDALIKKTKEIEYQSKTAKSKTYWLEEDIKLLKKQVQEIKFRTRSFRY